MASLIVPAELDLAKYGVKASDYLPGRSATYNPFYGQPATWGELAASVHASVVNYTEIAQEQSSNFTTWPANMPVILDLNNPAAIYGISGNAPPPDNTPAPAPAGASGDVGGLVVAIGAMALLAGLVLKKR